MSGDWEEFWSTVPEKAHHPTRDLMLEALWWIGEPLSAIDLVDVLDGFLTMWEAVHHLPSLEELGVVERTSGGSSAKRNQGDLDVAYRLKAENGNSKRRRRS